VSNYFCETEGVGKCLLDGGIALSPLCNLMECSKHLHYKYPFFEKIFAKGCLRQLIKPNKHLFMDKDKDGTLTKTDYEQCIKSTSVVEIDEFFTRRALGFKCVKDYYKAQTFLTRIKNISKPLLCMFTKDDAII
jgi:predicted alpha/beta-fold hydrolase